jgi:hypothetical protein
MLNAIGWILLDAALAVILVAITCALTITRSQRLGLALVAGLWVGVATVAPVTGVFDDRVTGSLALLVLFLAPIVAAVLVLSFSAGARSAVLSLPMPLLIGLNVFRAEGVFFLLLAAAGQLGGPFPYSAGWGDIITGSFALPVAYLAARNTNAGRLVALWNTIGVLDLLTAVNLGVFSRNGSAIQLIHAGVGTEAITHLPWSLIPTVLVPYFLVMHFVIFAQLRAAKP